MNAQLRARFAVRRLHFTFSSFLAASLLVSIGGTHAFAAPITWTVDSSQSYVRLTIPDQNITVPGLGTATLRIRNGDGATWSDAGGRLAAVTGTLSTNFVVGSSIEFLGGAHNLTAVEGTLLRPNPAQFTGPPTISNPYGSYVGTGTALAAFGGSYRETTLGDIGRFALRSVGFDLDGGPAALTGGNFAGGTTDFHIDSALYDGDFNTLLVVGQPIADVLHVPKDFLAASNSGGGSITDLGGGNYMMIYTVDAPIVMEILESGPAFQGTASGQIVAFATVPEPSTVVLLGIGLVSIVGWIRARR